MKKDIEIAQEANIRPIAEIAATLGIPQDELEMYGRYKAKIPLHFIDEERIKNAKLILVTAITPTPAGEGKTTTSIGLAQALNLLGKKTTVVLREPSLGPVFARDLKAQGVMAVLLRDAIKPNLVQTLEGTPAIIHGGPFANIAQGTNSIIATKTGLSLSDIVVTEAGFASELGAENFFNIKSRFGNLRTNAVVIVATIRALKYHGGVKLSSLQKEDLDALKKGFDNLDKHIENMKFYGFRPVVAINRFDSDTMPEIDLLMKHCESQRVIVALNESWSKGGEGAIDLAKKVLERVNNSPDCFRPLYELSWTFEKKISTICLMMYGADHVEYTVQAKEQLEKIERLGLGNLAVCIAKTQKSLSDDPNKKGRPRGFTVKIREVELSSGAGFIVPIAGTIMRMPGLPNNPSAENMDIDRNGVITGLF